MGTEGELIRSQPLVGLLGLGVARIWPIVFGRMDPTSWEATNFTMLKKYSSKPGVEKRIPKGDRHPCVSISNKKQIFLRQECLTYREWTT